MIIQLLIQGKKNLANTKSRKQNWEILDLW